MAAFTAIAEFRKDSSGAGSRTCWMAERRPWCRIPDFRTNGMR